ncbi:MAG: hypothetical protein ACO1RT_02725 [Planctomycetaceae bacterium]
MLGNLLWGAPDWIWPAAAAVGLITLVVIWNYARRLAARGVPVAAMLLKFLALLLLAICLLDPMRSGTRPRPQANLFPILVDNSQSMTMQATKAGASRGERMSELLDDQSSWRVRLAQDFDVRAYRFASRREPMPAIDAMTFDGGASSLAGSLTALSERLRNRPVAGVLLFTDGNLTDDRLNESDWASLGFPVYPVISSRESAPGDLRIADVSVTQSDFETAPVAIKVSLEADSLPSQKVVVQLLDQPTEKLVQEQTLTMSGSEPAQPITLKFRPEKSGVGFYRVIVFREADRALVKTGQVKSESTFANNSRWLAIDRGRGPYRVLYVSGRPNWDFKFIRRAVQTDPEVKLVGLLRIANKEPKFSFRDRDVSTTNPLFAGLGGDEEEAAQQYDEPVMLRLGVEVSDELSDGFPRSSEELFGYQAVIIDDIEPDFFTQDQLLMLRKFVAFRGGGLLMLGGQESFDNRSFGASPLGEMAPVYPPRKDADTAANAYRLELTREGLLQPWFRLRDTEDSESERLRRMPTFNTLSPVGDAKPGAIQLATLRDNLGGTAPGLVVQRFGKGKSAALALGDIWKWSMRREKKEDDEPARLWRQMMRWLVNDVPHRVELEIQPSEAGDGQVTIRTDVRDEAFLPLDNAKVEIEVLPVGVQNAASAKPATLIAQSEGDQAGRYQATFFAGDSGGYLASARVLAQDGSEIGTAQSGWVAQPGEAEFRQWDVNRPLLAKIAEQTGGEIVDDRELDRFVADLDNRKVPVSEVWTYPLWHHPWVMLAAILCLCGEWGLRRMKGLP